MTIVRVGLDVPIDKLFDYRCNGATDADIGTRVLVPFGKRSALGVVLDIADASDVPAAQLKSVVRFLRDVPPLSKHDLLLLRFAADYYHHPLGAVVHAALPVRLRHAGRPASRLLVHYTLTEAGKKISVEDLPARSTVKRQLLAEFHAQCALDDTAIRAIAPTARAALNQFIASGWVAQCEGAKPESPSAPAAASQNPATPELTEEQHAAVTQLCAALDAFHTHLLLGVTGSGKTEVYLRVIDAVLRSGRQALLLVPEIALTPQLDATVRGRFPGVHLATLHSGLNETERLQHWLAAQSGHARIVLGTRLAVFAPMPELGLIVVDEEHDASFKQSEGFRYSARDLAVVRAHQRNIPIILGSATPALETYANASGGRYRLINMSRRINAELPRISCVSTRHEKLDGGLSQTLITAIETRLAKGEQSLIFLNRRGYAPVLMCHGCGWLSGCHRCAAKLVLHLHDRRLHCHHCGYQSMVPLSCPDCGNADLSPVGHGTQRVEAAIHQRFPQSRILRIDRDSTRRRGAFSSMRKQIQAREIDILIGTQLLAKGHDFPHLSLVGVINADALLYSTDFRAPERLYALLTQVAGRAGRGSAPGHVLIQTEFPDHPLYAALRKQEFSAFADNLITERKQAGFPPFVHQALLRAEAAKLDAAIAWLQRAAEAGHSLAGDVEIFDPVAASMARLAGRERAQLLVQCANRGTLQHFLARWCEQLAAAKSHPVRWSLDVDPAEL